MNAMLNIMLSLQLKRVECALSISPKSALVQQKFDLFLEFEACSHICWVCRSLELYLSIALSLDRSQYLLPSSSSPLSYILDAVNGSTRLAVLVFQFTDFRHKEKMFLEIIKKQQHRITLLHTCPTRAVLIIHT